MLLELSVALGITAGLVQLWGYRSYLRYVERPNTGSWSIWTFGAGIDLVSYFAVTKDWALNILPGICAIACLVVFVYAVKKKLFSPIDRMSCFFLGLDMGLTILWIMSGDTVATNLWYQVSTFLSFIPITYAVLKGTDKEDVRPWIIWVIAYSLFTLTAILRSERIEELAFPGVLLTTHIMVLLAVLYKASMGSVRH